MVESTKSHLARLDYCRMVFLGEKRQGGFPRSVTRRAMASQPAGRRPGTTVAASAGQQGSRAAAQKACLAASQCVVFLQTRASKNILPSVILESLVSAGQRRCLRPRVAFGLLSYVLAYSPMPQRRSSLGVAREDELHCYTAQ